MNVQDMLYKTLYQEAHAEIEIERSIFIAHVKPVDSKEEADRFLNDIKKKYKDATHNVPAMVIGDKFQIQWCSDDGEPAGTSGPPILQMLVKDGITNTIVVITRYFGGIKLGTGGLVRAYVSAAKAGIENAGIAEVHEMREDSYVFDYSFLDKIKNREKQGDFRIGDLQYSDKINMKIISAQSDADGIYGELMNITGGSILKTCSDTVYSKIKV